MAEGEADSGAGAQVSVFQALEADDPAQLGDYTLAARLGAGGMGEVYLSHTLAGRPVAIKAIRPELADDPGFRRRFRHEVEAARRVHGLYTAPVIDSEIDTTPLWLATAFVQGPTLSAAVTRHGTLPVPSVLLLAAGVAEALQAVHGEGIIHRDLKASNVLLAMDGPRVIDFGIARAADSTALTETGVAVGTPPFMSPEQATSNKIGPATDVFSLGQLVTYAAKGTPAFGEGQTHGVLYRIVHEEPDLTDVPEDLLPLLNRCLTKDPDERASLAEVIQLCRAASEDGMLRRAGNWLPEAVTVDITRHQDVPVPPRSRTDHLPADAEAEPAHTGSPEVNGDAPARAWADEERNADAVTSGPTWASPPAPSASHSDADSTSHPPVEAPTPDPSKTTLTDPLKITLTDPLKVWAPEPLGPAPFTHRPTSDPSERDDAAGAGASWQPTSNGAPDISLERLHPAAGNFDRPPPAAAPPPARKPISRRAILALGATALAGAGGTAAVVGVGDDSDAKTPQDAPPKQINVKTTETLDYHRPVSCVTFLNGETLTTGSTDGAVRLWNPTTRRTTTGLTGHKKPVASMALSPDGRTLATSDVNGTVDLRNVATRKTTTTLASLKGTIASMAFSPDGKTLATGDVHGTVHLRNVATRKTTTTLASLKGTIASVAFSPDGNILAIGDTSGTVFMWNAETRKTTTAPTRHKKPVASMAFSPDGNTLAIGDTSGTVFMWNMATRKHTATLTGHKKAVRSVAFSPNGKTLATGSRDHTARLWNVATRKTTATLTGHNDAVRSVAFSPDGKTLATGSHDETARLWKASGDVRL